MSRIGKWLADTILCLACVIFVFTVFFKDDEEE